MSATELVLCRSGINSGPRHHSSTGSLSNQLDDCSLLRVTPRERRNENKQGCRPSGTDSHGHADQAVPAGEHSRPPSKTNKAWDGPKAANSRALQQRVSQQPADKESSLLCRSLVKKQLRLLMPSETPPCDDKLFKSRINKVTSQTYSETTGKDFECEPLLNNWTIQAATRGS